MVLFVASGISLAASVIRNSGLSPGDFVRICFECRLAFSCCGVIRGRANDGQSTDGLISCTIKQVTTVQAALVTYYVTWPYVIHRAKFYSCYHSYTLTIDGTGKHSYDSDVHLQEKSEI